MNKELEIFIRHWKRSDEHLYHVSDIEESTRFAKVFSDGAKWYSIWNWSKGYRYTILDETKGRHCSRRMPISLDMTSAYKEAQNFG